MIDYKYEMQLMAEEAAEEQFGQDISALPQEIQNRLYDKAEHDWIDDRIARAEASHDE